MAANGCRCQPAGHSPRDRWQAGRSRRAQASAVALPPGHVGVHALVGKQQRHHRGVPERGLASGSHSGWPCWPHAIVGKQHHHHRGVLLSGMSAGAILVGDVGVHDRQQQRHHRGVPFVSGTRVPCCHSARRCWGPHDRWQAATHAPRTALTDQAPGRWSPEPRRTLCPEARGLSRHRTGGAALRRRSSSRGFSEEEEEEEERQQPPCTCERWARLIR